MPPAQAIDAAADRKRLGAWYTPPALVDLVADAALRRLPVGVTGPVRVLDPAAGDGRFLTAAAARLRAGCHAVELTACDVDAAAIAAIGAPGVRRIHGDALARDWGDERFDVVIGNPPFLSQMAAATTRRGASRHGGGPYADAAAEFLALAVRLADPRHGVVALVLPQSILAARDAGPVRDAVARQADLAWSWWEPVQRHFDAAVNVCALCLRRPATAGEIDWTAVVTGRLGVPSIDRATLDAAGTIGDRATIGANFRDEYYALVPAVSDAAAGPPLVTSGLIDPGACHWGARPVRFARRLHAAPRVDLARLDGRFATWAARKLVPKVLVANQTRVIEAVADPDGAWLPGVPVNTVVPRRASPARVWELAAALTNPVASALAWHASAGTGLGATTLRVGPALLADLPWPAGPLDGAVAALRDADVEACGALAAAAYGMADVALERWWTDLLPVNRQIVRRGGGGAKRSPAPSRGSPPPATAAPSR